MQIDDFGIQHASENELCDVLYNDPHADIFSVPVDDPTAFNHAVMDLFYDCKKLERYCQHGLDIEQFDELNQSKWFMPDEYKQMDIAKFVLDQCHAEEELQRAGKELLMYQDRELMPLLQYMKYFVDTMRANNVVWGVGRGSSVASYVLFIIGVHKVNSLYFDLPIEEFLK